MIELLAFLVSSSLALLSVQSNDGIPANGLLTRDEINSAETSFYSIFTLLLAWICLLWYIVVVSLSILGAYVVMRRNTVCSMPPASSTSEGVTVLRPLKGIDCELEACLESSFQQEYPDFEIILCVDSMEDPAAGVAEKLISKYPKVNSRILVGAEPCGPNPKINNLAKGYQQARHDIIWVVDANVWLSPGALKRSVAEFDKDPRISLVHHLPLALSIKPGWKGNLGAKLDEMFMLTAHSKFYTAINSAALAACVMGKSNLYRRSLLDRAVGAAEGEGIRPFASYIAEDNMIADALWRSGGRTAMTSDSAIQPLSDVRLQGYWNRRVRWLRVRKYMVFAATLLEPTTESIVCGIFGSFGLSVIIFTGYSLFSFKYFSLHLCIWCMIDYWHFHNLLRFGNVENRYGETPFFVAKYYNPEGSRDGSVARRLFFRSWFPIWLLRETLAFPIWVAAMCGNTIQWRNLPFRIKSDQTAEEVID